MRGVGVKCFSLSFVRAQTKKNNLNQEQVKQSMLGEADEGNKMKMMMMMMMMMMETNKAKTPKTHVFCELKWAGNDEILIRGVKIDRSEPCK